MSIAEYTAYQRRLLATELSRQGLTANSRDAILSNFDCFKMYTQDHTSAADMLSARIRCTHNPILGINRLFAPWVTAIGRSSTIHAYSSQYDTMRSRYHRTKDVAEMHAELNGLISPRESEVNIHTLDNLIDLHLSLMSTNEALEKRIRPMQNNCMKGQPGIVGACRQ